MSSRSQYLAESEHSAFIEQVGGREKGRPIALVGERLTIGRADDNDIVVPTEGVSRYHAILERSDGGWLIKDNQSKNGVLVNGKPTQEASLSPGDMVQVGTFVFRFNEGAISEVADEDGGDVSALGPEPEAMEEYALPGATKPKKAPNRRALIYGVVGLVLVALWYFSASSSDDKKGTDGKTTSVTAAKTPLEAFSPAPAPDLNVSSGNPSLPVLEDPVLKQAEQDMQKLDWTNSGLRESEAFFRKGQREYLDKNYQRAIDDFLTALTIYRGHELAAKYLQRTYNESEQAAKLNMEIGVKYFESLHYQRAIYNFTQVIDLLSHRPNEALSQEAAKYIEQCKRRLEAAELFP